MAKTPTTQTQSALIASLGLDAKGAQGTIASRSVDRVLSSMEEWGFSAAEIADDVTGEPIPAMVAPFGPTAALVYADPTTGCLTSLLLGPEEEAVRVSAESLRPTSPDEPRLSNTIAIISAMRSTAALAETVSDWLEPARLYATC